MLLWLYPSHLIPSNRRLWDNREKYGCIRTDICVWDGWGLMKKHSGLGGSDLFTSSDTEWHFHLSSALIGRSASTLIFRGRLPYRHTHTHTHTHSNACLPLALIMTYLWLFLRLLSCLHLKAGFSFSPLLKTLPAASQRHTKPVVHNHTHEYSVIICSPVCCCKLKLQSLVTQKLLYVIRGLAIYHTDHFYGVFTTV